MSFLDNNIIIEVHLKNNTILKSSILKNYPQEQQTNVDEILFNFNLVKFETTPFPVLALLLRKFLDDVDDENDLDFNCMDIEERYVAFIFAKELSFIRLMDTSFLNKYDKSLLSIEEQK